MSIIQIIFNRRIQILDADTLTTRKIEIGTRVGDNDNSRLYSRDKAREKNVINLVYHGRSHYNAAVQKKQKKSAMDYGPSMTETLDGIMGLCIFSDASSVNRVLSLKPLFILRREIRMSATPWPDVPEFAMLGSTESSSCSSSSELSSAESGSQRESIHHGRDGKVRNGDSSRSTTTTSSKETKINC